MKPLQWVGLGLVLLVLSTPVDGFDLYADPVGWAMLLLGVRTLPTSFPFRFSLTYVGVLALLVSVPLWTPAVIDALNDADPALAWACDLPRFGFLALLALALSRAADEDADRRARAWWRTVLVGAVAVALLPVLVFGGGLDGLDGVAGALVVLVPVTATVLAFVHAGRRWAGAPAPAVTAD